RPQPQSRLRHFRSHQQRHRTAPARLRHRHRPKKNPHRRPPGLVGRPAGPRQIGAEYWSDGVMETPPLHILVIKPSSLGDVIHALPTVNLLRQRLRDAHIAWLINAELSSLLKHCPVIDDHIEFRRGASASWLTLL